MFSKKQEKLPRKIIEKGDNGLKSVKNQKENLLRKVLP